MRKVRIAVVGGASGVGRGSHLPAIASLEAAELVAVCDTNEAALAEATGTFGCAGYTDYAAMLSSERIDLVDVTSPDFLHAEHTVLAAERGLHVLCEKPMALSMAEAGAMRDAVRAAGVKFMVGQSQRWRPECRAFREACDRIGRAAFGAYHVKGRFFPYPEGNFYRKRESLGQFVHNGMHYVDFLSWCMGELPVRVHAYSTRHYPAADRLETDNYLVAQMTYAGGATAVYELNLLMIDPPGFPSETRWYVIGSEGTAEWSLRGQRCVEAFGEAGISYPPGSPPGPQTDPFAGEIGHMCECILEDREPCIPLSWSMRILEACIGAVTSAESGKTVELAAG